MQDLVLGGTQVANVGVFGVKLGNPLVKCVNLIGTQSFGRGTSDILRFGGHDGQGTLKILNDVLQRSMVSER